MPLEKQPSISSPAYKDPYANIAAKPNNVKYESNYQLHNQVPAGMLSEIRKASPSDSIGQPERQSRGRDGQGSLARIGNETAGRAANAMMHDYAMPEYGSV